MSDWRSRALPAGGPKLASALGGWRSRALPDTSEPAADESGGMGDAAQTGLEQYGNTVTMGYLPHLQALAGKFMPDPNADLDEKLRAHGFDVKNAPDPSYIAERDANIRRMAEMAKANPNAARLGTVAGIAGGALLTPGMGAAKGLGELAIQGGKTGAIMGALANPGDVEGELSGLQLPERIENMGKGAAAGVAIPLAVGGLGKLGGKVSDYLRGKADEKSFMTTGGTKGQLRAMLKKDPEGMRAIGRDMLDEGIVTPLTTPKRLARRLETAIDDTEGKLGSVLDEVEAKLSDQKFWKTLKPQERKEIIAASFKPQQEATRLKAEIAKQYDKVPKEKLQSAFDEIDSWLGSKAKVMGIKDTQAFKVQMNKFLKDSDFAKGANQVGLQKTGTLAVRRALKEGVEKKADALARIMGDQGGAVKATNQRLGRLIEAAKMAEDRIAGDTANRAIGLTDTLQGGFGASVGGSLAGPPGAVVGGLAGAGVNKFGRTFGRSLQATGFNEASKILADAPAIGEMLARTSPALTGMGLRAKQAIQGGPSFSTESTDPALGDPKLLQFFQQYPNLVDALIAEPDRREAIKKRLRRQPAKEK